jgi:hypothetical protein
MSRTLRLVTPRRTVIVVFALVVAAALAAPAYANGRRMSGMPGPDDRRDYEPRTSVTLRGIHFPGRDFDPDPQVGSGRVYFQPPTICDYSGCVKTRGPDGVIHIHHNHR